MRTGPIRVRHARAATTLTLALALTLALLLATPALAHPFVVGGGRVPVQSLASIQLDLAHGCGVERAGAGPDTDEVALEVPDWLRIVDVPEPDGWRVSIEDATDTQLDAGVTGVVVWAADGGAEPAPRFALDVVVDGEAGETRFLRVSQRCGDAVERWVGTPDEPAEQPAVRLRLEPVDPASPPPPLPEPEPQPQPAPKPAPAPEPAPQPVPAPDTPAASSSEHAAPDATDAGDAAADDPAATGGRRTAAIAAVGGALAVAAALAERRRRVRGGRAPSR